jgi:hypothetical protein
LRVSVLFGVMCAGMKVRERRSQPAHRPMCAGGRHEHIADLPLLDRDFAAIGQKTRADHVAGHGPRHIDLALQIVAVDIVAHGVLLGHREVDGAGRIGAAIRRIPNAR